MSLVHRILAGDPRALAQAATLIENRSDESTALLQGLFAYSGRALLIGFTGAPGVGKSTLVTQAARLARKDGHSVGIIAVDPTSPYSGGALLGDRIRMMEHQVDSGVFIRSMASRGSLGGLAAAAADVALLLDAAGREIILIETVGTGQGETAISYLADVTVVVITPGFGDDVQALKAGMLEIADVFALNKADRPGTDSFERELKAGSSRVHRQDGWAPPVIRTIATEGFGVEDLWSHIHAFHEVGRNTTRRVNAWASRLAEMLRERVLRDFPRCELYRAAQEIVEHRRDPYTVVEEWLERVRACHCPGQS